MGGAIVSVDAKAKQEQLIEFILILKFLLWRSSGIISGGGKNDGCRRMTTLGRWTLDAGQRDDGQ